jgi:HAD superfamily hydrolase (TIGR01484 family)
MAKAREFYARFEGSLHVSLARSPAFPGVEFANVVAPDVSKGRALEALSLYLGISLSEVMAVGDGTNDLTLLSQAGLAVAMDNAPDEVKAVADHITLDVEQNGLAAAIERFLL